MFQSRFEECFKYVSGDNHYLLRFSKNSKSDNVTGLKIKILPEVFLQLQMDDFSNFVTFETASMLFALFQNFVSLRTVQRYVIFLN